MSENIHNGFINIETWCVHPDCDIENMDLMDDNLPNEAVIGNTEIELSIEEAKDLVSYLQIAITAARSG